MTTDFDDSKIPEVLTDKEIEELYKTVEKNPNQVVELIERKLEISNSELFAGPLPHPDILKGYEEVDESFPDRIFRLTEKDQEHRSGLENYVVRENFKLNNLGMRFALTIVILSMLAGTFLLYNDKDVAGLTTMFTPLIGIIGAFIYGKHEDKE